jgi:hypothetical protein
MLRDEVLSYQYERRDARAAAAACLVSSKAELDAEAAARVAADADAAVDAFQKEEASRHSGQLRDLVEALHKQVQALTAEVQALALRGAPGLPKNAMQMLKTAATATIAAVKMRAQAKAAADDTDGPPPAELSALPTSAQLRALSSQVGALTAVTVSIRKATAPAATPCAVHDDGSAATSAVDSNRADAVLWEHALIGALCEAVAGAERACTVCKEACKRAEAACKSADDVGMQGSNPRQAVLRLLLLVGRHSLGLPHCCSRHEFESRSSRTRRPRTRQRPSLAWQWRFATGRSNSGLESPRRCTAQRLGCCSI